MKKVYEEIKQVVATGLNAYRLRFVSKSEFSFINELIILITLGDIYNI